MNKRIALLLCLILALPLLAQEKPKEGTTVYKLEYTVTELEGAKKLSSRTYSVLVLDGKGARLRIGTRVPLALKEDQVQYNDLGVNIDADVKSVDTAIMLRTRFDVSGLVAVDANPGRRTVFRQFNNQVETVVPLDKPVMLSSQDEPGSNVTFQVTVVARIVK